MSTLGNVLRILAEVAKTEEGRKAIVSGVSSIAGMFNLTCKHPGGLIWLNDHEAKCPTCGSRFRRA